MVEKMKHQRPPLFNGCQKILPTSKFFMCHFRDVPFGFWLCGAAKVPSGSFCFGPFYGEDAKQFAFSRSPTNILGQ
jgi:hypothetical protein